MDGSIICSYLQREDMNFGSKANPVQHRFHNLFQILRFVRSLLTSYRVLDMVITMTETIVPGAENVTGYEPPLAAGILSEPEALVPGTDPHGMSMDAGNDSLPDEFEIFRTFIMRHLRAIANADVQCMLLWTEWVRFHIRLTKKFPRLILEQEFRDVITGLFNTKVSLDEHRGRVYPGVGFIP